MDAIDSDCARRAMISLTGLALGDGFGQRFSAAPGMGPSGEWRLPPGRWEWTDGTETACSVYTVLHRYGRIDQDALAAEFAARFDPGRGYGAATQQLPRNAGGDWRELAASRFDGAGSFGSGAAKRSAPLGAWFSDDVPEAARQAALAAEVTHAHPEGVAGAVAVAVAAAIAARREPIGAGVFLNEVLGHVPSGQVRDGVRDARALLVVSGPVAVAGELGCGKHSSSQDTVPFALWAAAKQHDDYPAALWETARAGGDAGTMCAIVGGILAPRVPGGRLPPEWLSHGEPLPEWVSL
ncbi:ADP-ribosylglycohydrolase family protein [Allosalinactinospora lopnorensis]|uniref:ADP-ribosylglycohydrolase family protein n=1 Tax=Allosalinactinospora lopnorensis TaxID=1352348 RepID=UPI000623F55E|nr:ADP-ribosylglycohydrolase family protein [Allosalinactinospora lopnorensis]